MILGYLVCILTNFIDFKINGPYKSLMIIILVIIKIKPEIIKK